MTDIHEFMLRLPQKIHDRLVAYKEFSGVSITNQIYNAIVWWLITKNMISLDEINGNKKRKEIALQEIPEALNHPG